MSDQSQTTQATPAKVITRAHASWTGAHRWSVKGKGTESQWDADAGDGPSPVEALLGALATCAGTDVVDILAKRRTPAEKLEIEMIGGRVPTTPRRLEHVRMAFVIDGKGIERDQAERAIALAVTKYCSVRDSLSRDITIEWTLELNGEPGEPIREVDAS